MYVEGDASATADPMKVSFNIFAPYRGVVQRFFLLVRHFSGLLMGALVSYANNLPPYKKRWFRKAPTRLLAFFLRWFIKKEYRKASFPYQLRRRLEQLGPTYVKLGQIMSIREDIFPNSFTEEMQNLLDRVPEVPYEDIERIVEAELGFPLRELFLEFRREPIGSASIGQTHRATTSEGRPVVVKVIKPGIRDTILSDLKLLKWFAVMLEWIIPRYQPSMIAQEFARYTVRATDLPFEADHAEIFAANFAEVSDVVFPEIFRDLSTANVLTMEYLDGFKPNDARMLDLPGSELDQIVDTGLGAIIKMLYEDGFFHADLHPANVIIMPGPQLGFIDLGMVGRFDDNLKRHMLYYFSALVNNDIDSAVHQLTAMARIGEGSDPASFRREVADVLRRYRLQVKHGQYSLARLILESLRIGGRYRIGFPMEMTLMVKSLVTFEGVGQRINPNLDVPGLSRRHVRNILLRRYHPERLFNQVMAGLPEILDLAVNLPRITADSSKALDEYVNRVPQPNPVIGLRGSIMGGAFVLGAVIALVQGASPFLWVPLGGIGVLFYFWGK